VYRQFFEFADEPFRLTPDPRYLFLSRKHAEALAHLRLGLTESSGFVCITGEIGTGKTTLLRAFLAELGPGVTAAYALTPPDSATDLLRRICRELGVPSRGESKVELLEALHAHLIAETAAGRVCVVVLDEAQALSAALMEEIRLLLNLETETKKLLRIVLVGQPQLRKLLLDPALAQLNQRITLRWHLEALSYGETVAYVRHRLEVASEGPAQPLFTKPALRLLYSVSGGVPRLINMIAHRALLVAFVAREPQVRRAHVARAYSELQAVPLPGTLTPRGRAHWRRPGWRSGYHSRCSVCRSSMGSTRVQRRTPCGLRRRVNPPWSRRPHRRLPLRLPLPFERPLRGLRPPQNSPNASRGSGSRRARARRRRPSSPPGANPPSSRPRTVYPTISGRWPGSEGSRRCNSRPTAACSACSISPLSSRCVFQREIRTGGATGTSGTRRSPG
jgi:type II secretory pathway predicted ATPase ExeA